jgi:DNA-binding NtrC family response regulator
MKNERVLVVDDEQLIRWSLRSGLEEEGYTVGEAGSGKEALAALAQDDWDLVFLDHRLPDTTGLQVLERIHADNPDVCVVMMTAFGTVEDAVQAMKLGAYDYLTKPVRPDEMVVVAAKALETTRLRREVRRLRAERQDQFGKFKIVGTSPAMAEVLAMVEKICASPATTVLLEGESGTGKNVVAKAIHYASPRRDAPFVNITCSALTESLLESELFGHERGAFTDAKTQKKGLLEVAAGGTAFLDEIGEMGPAMQAKLLRFLEEKSFKRVGGTRDIKVDVRIIAATNRDLDQDVHDGRFRQDLYYRLEVIPIRIPPLRERQEDIPALAQHFLDEFNRELRRETEGLTPAAIALLLAHDWPGNVRELRNVIERVMILEDKHVIDAGDLPTFRKTAEPSGDDGAPEVGRRLPVGRLSLDELERAAIRQALDASGGNQVRAAKLLGISRDTLRYRIKKYELGGDQGS